MRPQSLEFLQRLLNTPSPSSGELAGQRVWIDYVTQFAEKVETDAYGNATAILNSSGNPKVMVAGHSDEIAFQIQYIDDQGFIYFAAVGGPDPALARGQRVHIHTAKGQVLGVVGSLARHMQDRTKKAQAPEWHEMFIDIGAANRRAAEARVAVGDLITFTAGYQQLAGDIFIARGCDNRIGTFIAAETLRLCSEQKKIKACLVAASTVQEEVGLHGGMMVGYAVQPDIALVVDVAHATDFPAANKKQFGEIKLGKGPILSRGSVNHPVLVQRMADVAKKNRIDYQRGIDPIYSGTDADEIFKQRGGIPTLALGVPNRYMHSPIEAIHLGDLEKMAKWLSLLVSDLKMGERFKVKI